jgi:hypothetical protein
MPKPRFINLTSQASAAVGYFGEKYATFGELFRDVEFDVARAPEDGDRLFPDKDQPRGRKSAAAGDPPIHVLIRYSFTSERVHIEDVVVRHVGGRIERYQPG